LKLVGLRRVSHVDDLAADPGAGLFAGLVSLPKATALTTYSYRLSHERERPPLMGDEDCHDEISAVRRREA
jgi:hypothetical protein